MTTVDSVAGPRTAASGRLTTLIGQEARRLARHPVLWLVPVVIVVTAALDGASAGRNASYWYGTIFVAVAFFAPLIVLFAANLVASSARRSRAEEMLEATPTTRHAPDLGDVPRHRAPPGRDRRRRGGCHGAPRQRQRHPARSRAAAPANSPSSRSSSPAPGCSASSAPAGCPSPAAR